MACQDGSSRSDGRQFGRQRSVPVTWPALLDERLVEFRVGRCADHYRPQRCASRAGLAALYRCRRQLLAFGSRNPQPTGSSTLLAVEPARTRKTLAAGVETTLPSPTFCC